MFTCNRCGHEADEVQFFAVRHPDGTGGRLCSACVDVEWDNTEIPDESRAAIKAYYLATYGTAE